MDDEKIIELYWERNTLAIDQTAEKYGNYCSAIARNILRNEEDSEECVNDTWLGAWNSIPPKRPNNLATFLGKLTRCKAIDRWRTEHREKRGGCTILLALDEIAETIPAGDSPEQEVMRKELVRTIDRFLDELPELERNVFLCRYWYFESISEIGRRFDFSYSKVKSILLRTRKKLRDFLKMENML